jgi:predicted GNAT family acetyltransferase
MQELAGSGGARVLYEDLNVTNNEAAQRYEIRVDGQLARLEYRRLTDRLLFTHTEVPTQLQGRGIGGLMVRAALDDARAHGQQVVPLCSFVRWYIRQHPEYRDLVAAASPAQRQAAG